MPDFEDVLSAGIAGRPLYVFFLLDCSGSMKKDGKIQSLNNAIHEVLPALRDEAAGHAGTDLLVQVMAFSDDAHWVTPEPVLIDEFQWTDLSATGVTSTGTALALLAASLGVPPMPPRAVPPVLILVSDGRATDDFDQGFEAVLAKELGRKAIRISIAIGEDADEQELSKFLSHRDVGVLRANDPLKLLHLLKWATVQGSRSSLAPLTVAKTETSGESTWAGALPPASGGSPPEDLGETDHPRGWLGAINQ